MKTLTALFFLLPLSANALVIERDLKPKEKVKKEIKQEKKQPKHTGGLSNVNDGFKLECVSNCDYTRMSYAENMEPEILTFNITVKSLQKGFDKENLEDLSTFISEVNKENWEQPHYLVMMGLDKQQDNYLNQAVIMKNNFISLGIETKFVETRLINYKSTSVDPDIKNMIEIIATKEY